MTFIQNICWNVWWKIKCVIQVFSFCVRDNINSGWLNKWSDQFNLNWTFWKTLATNFCYWKVRIRIRTLSIIKQHMHQNHRYFYFFPLRQDFSTPHDVLILEYILLYKRNLDSIYDAKDWSWLIAWLCSSWNYPAYYWYGLFIALRQTIQTASCIYYNGT